MKKLLPSLLCVLVMAAILIQPARYIKSASDGVLVFALNVLPSLFPFMFLTKILTELGTLQKAAKPFGRVTRKLYRTGGSSAYLFIMSLVSGYPVGAKLISEFREKGLVGSAESSRLAAFCCTSGPLFIIGTVGTSMLCSLKAGFLVFAAHLLGALLNGVLYRGYKRKEPLQEAPAPLLKAAGGNALYESVYGAVLSILVVGGFITLFYVFIDIAGDFYVLAPLAGLLDRFFALFSLPPGAGAAVANGLLEATRGCLDVSRLGLAPLPAGALCCFVLSFGGLSIFMQCMAYLGSAGVKPGYYLLVKLTHAALSTLLFLALGVLFGL